MRYCEEGCCVERAAWRRKLLDEHPTRSTEAYCEKHKREKEDNRADWVELLPEVKP